jgi:hypothetical protein
MLSNRQSSQTCGIIERTAYVIESIDRVNQWMISHEFILIQEHWDISVSAYDDQITELTQLINCAIHPPKPEDVNNSSRGVGGRSVNKHAIPLAQSLIPLTKLSRVLLKKLAKDALNQIPSQSFTDMNSCQSAKLSDSGRVMERTFYDMKISIAEYDEGIVIAGFNPPEPIKVIIHDLIRHLNSSILLIIIYVIPLIPDSISSSNLLQDFLVKWRNLFLIAAQNCICAAQAPIMNVFLKNFSTIFNYV